MYSLFGRIVGEQATKKIGTFPSFAKARSAAVKKLKRKIDPCSWVFVDILVPGKGHQKVFEAIRTPGDLVFTVITDEDV